MRTLPFALTGLNGALGVVLALWALLSNREADIGQWAVTPFVRIVFRLDPLGAFFLLVISGGAIAASLYAAAYVEHGPRTAGWGSAAFCIFILAMELLVLADSVFAFLLAWELMSLSSYFLVIQHHRSASVRQAGWIYAAMTHFGTAFLLAAFFLLARNANGLDFADFRALKGSLDPLAQSLVFLLAFVGFGTKAGVIPFHVWLPRAHPAAPSHVSALMSGVMIKTGIFGLLRVGLQFTGPGPAWWGWLILLFGLVSAVLGVLYALMEHDLKRLLAFHSIENIGIILIGLGVAFIAFAEARAEIAALALAAALFHVLNHAVFKMLLFMGAGAVQQGAHTRDLERLGGLIKRMPWTAATFLIGAAAISALPPLNGFASEWLTFQGLLGLAAARAEAASGVALALSAGLLGLTGALALACFVKAFGIAFLAQPRSKGAAHASEVSWPMIGAMVLLATLCIGVGLLPNSVMRLLAPVVVSVVGPVSTTNFALGQIRGTDEGVLAPILILGFLLVLSLLPVLLGRLIGGPSRARIAPTWVCGVALEPSMQYSSTALVKPIRIIFRALIRPYREIELHHAIAPYFVSGVRYQAGVVETYERLVYRPVFAAVVGLAKAIRRLQNGSVRTYLAYICAALVVVLLLVTR